MKRLFGLLMALFVMLACAGCGGGNEEKAPADEQKSDKVGALMPIGLDEEGYKRWTESIAESEGRPAGYVVPNTVIFYDNMSAMIMALESKQIDRFATCSRVGNYIAVHNDKLQVIDNNFKPILGYSVGMLEKDAAQVEEINAAINAMKDDGTLANLVKENITDVGNADARH